MVAGPLVLPGRYTALLCLVDVKHCVVYNVPSDDRIFDAQNANSTRSEEVLQPLRLGIYGGTFDPIHFGHVAVARDVFSVFKLSRVIFVPARQSPMRGPPIASARDRLAMVRLALGGTGEFGVSSIDVDRPAPSFMIDTVQHFLDEHPSAEMFVIIGADALADISSWRKLDELMDLAQIIAVPRSGFSMCVPSQVEAELVNARYRVHLHSMPKIDISASHVRALCARQSSISACVPPAVAKYVAAHQLYVNDQRGCSTPK